MALESLVKTGKGVTVVGKSNVGKEPTPNGQEKRRANGAGSFKVVSPRVNLLYDAPLLSHIAPLICATMESGPRRP